MRLKKEIALEQVRQLHEQSRTQLGWDWALWARWVFANMLGEVIGLGAAAIVGVTLAWSIERSFGAFAGVTLAIVMILVGTFEGVVVGVAQWSALRRPFPKLRLSHWTLAAAVGAFVAWTLGMTPSTLMDMGNTSAQASAPPFEMNDTLTYAFAAIMGVILGPILGVPQWLALRRHVTRAGWWIPANAVAWAVGMPVVFLGASVTPDGFVELIVTGLLTGAAAGAVVGAIHGAALVWLSRQPRR